MSRVVTITFSPCIDKSTSVPSLIPGKKLKCAEPTLEPGGGGINVARAIRQLGGEVLAIFPSGGYTGKFFNYLIANEGVPSIIIESANETRENIIVLDESTNNQYRFGMPGTRLSEGEWRHCLEAVENSEGVEFIVASGSLPPGVPMDIYARIARIARSKKARLIVDTSGEALIQAANERVYLIKPNLAELATLAGQEKVKLTDVERTAKEIIKQKYCEILVISMGREGAFLVTGKESYRVIPPEVPLKSTVGAGDSMVAGIVVALSKGMHLKQVLQYGVAAGTAATMNPGTALCRKEDTEQLYGTFFVKQ